MTLDQFVAKEVKKVLCLVCKLPQEIRDEISAGKRKGYKSTTMAAWLRSTGVAATDQGMRRHFLRRHK